MPRHAHFPPWREGNRIDRSLHLSPLALGDSHISKAPSGDHSMEFFEAMFEGDWAWRLGGWITIPAAKPGNDPSSPFETFLAVGIFLKRCCALEFSVEFVEDGNFVLSEGDHGGLGTGAIAGLEEVKGDCGSLGGHRCELDEALGGFAVATFEPEGLRFTQTPEFVNGPRHSFPGYKF